MVDLVLLFGKLALIALLYLFLLAAVRSGMGEVTRGRAGGARMLALAVTQGPEELAGIKLPLDRTLVIGRDPETDLTVADDFVSSHHARVSPAPFGGVLEDLESTNGTTLNGRRVAGRTRVGPGDVIGIGSVRVKVVAR